MPRWFTEPQHMDLLHIALRRDSDEPRLVYGTAETTAVSIDMSFVSFKFIKGSAWGMASEGIMDVLRKLLVGTVGRGALFLYRKHRPITEQRARAVPPESQLQMEKSVSSTSFFHV